MRRSSTERCQLFRRLVFEGLNGGSFWFFLTTFDWKIYTGGCDGSASAAVRGGGCNCSVPRFLLRAGVSEWRGGGSEIRTRGHSTWKVVCGASSG